MTASNGHADLLIVGGLRRDYGGVRAVDDASFSVPEGRITGLIGPNGLSLVPKPLASVLGVSPYGIQYQWFFVGITGVAVLVAYWFVHRITSAPLGRTLRAMRENEQVAMALGKNIVWLRLMIFMVGGALAAASGAILVILISAWSPSSWLFPETFSFFAAVIIGGSGNNLGVLVGALLVPVGFLEAARFLPQFGNPALVGALQWIAVGVLLLVFLWFWPRGVIPERRRRFPASRPGAHPGASVIRPGLAAPAGPAARPAED